MMKDGHTMTQEELKKLDATGLRDAKRERGSLLAALREGRATSRSVLTFGTCLDRYLDALEQGGVRGYSFVVWAPNARGVSVVGAFNWWDGRAHPLTSLGASGKSIT